MNEKGFGENFVWYEWSFVSPDDFPSADSDRERHEDDRPVRADVRPARFDGWDVTAR